MMSCLVGGPKFATLPVFWLIIQLRYGIALYSTGLNDMYIATKSSRTMVNTS